jgi:hypothetical protein
MPDVLPSFKGPLFSQHNTFSFESDSDDGEESDNQEERGSDIASSEKGKNSAGEPWCCIPKSYLKAVRRSRVVYAAKVHAELVLSVLPRRHQANVRHKGGRKLEKPAAFKDYDPPLSSIFLDPSARACF